MGAKRTTSAARVKRGIVGVIAAIVFMAMALPAGLFFYQYERIPRQVYQDASNKPARDPLLALERYLNRVGVKVTHTSWSQFKRRGLLTNEPVVLLDSSREAIDEKHDALLTWVKGGGHLIMAAVSDSVTATTSRPLLSSLGVKIAEPVLPEPVDPSMDAAGAESLFEFIEQMTGADLTLVVKNKQLKQAEQIEPQEQLEPLEQKEQIVSRVMILGTTSLVAVEGTDIRMSGTNRYGSQFLQVAYGKGRVSVFKSFDPLLDHALLDEDHLRFMLSLLDVPSPQVTKVTWLVASHPSPWMWLALQQAPVVFLLLLLAGLLWAWRSSIRFGPPLAVFDELSSSRQAEHIEASGWLIWRYQAEKELVDRLRRGLERRIEKRYPGAWSLPEREQFGFLAAHTGLSSEVLVRALYGDRAKTSRRARFVDTIKAIQQVSRSL